MNLTLKLINFINIIRLDFIKKYVESIMKASLIRYIKDVKLRDNLFDSKNVSELVLSVNINFFVNHKKSLKALT